MYGIQPPSAENFLGFVVSCVVAVLCGVIIGLERESKGKPAGLRTLVLISLGSCVFVEMSQIMAATHGDPSRIAAQIVSGIGFIGAGAILQKSESGYIAGLTTAASIWVTSAIGMMCGAKEYVLAVTGMIIVVACLRLLRSLESFLFFGSSLEVKRIAFESNFGKTRWVLIGLMEDHLVQPDEYQFKDDGVGRSILELRYIHKNRNHRGFLADAAVLPEILEIST